MQTFQSYPQSQFTELHHFPLKILTFVCQSKAFEVFQERDEKFCPEQRHVIGRCADPLAEVVLVDRKMGG